MNTKKFKNFIMYNNIIPIAVAVMFVGGAGAFAAQTVIQEVGISGAAQEVNIDPLVNLNIDNLDADLSILEIVDVEGVYEVLYEFTTYAAVDAVWQEVVKQDILKVRNNDRFDTIDDLREYVNEELYEVIEQDRVFLARAKKNAEKDTPELSLASLVGGFDVEKPDDVVVNTNSTLAQSSGPLQSVTRAISNIITISTGPIARNDGTGNDQVGEVSLEETTQEPTDEDPIEEETSTTTDPVEETSTSTATSTQETATSTEETATTTEPVEEETSTTTDPVEETSTTTATSTQETATSTEETSTTTDPVEEETSTTTDPVEEETSTTTDPVEEEPETEPESGTETE